MAETVTRTLPAQFIEDLGRDYGTQIAALTSLPVDTTKFAPTVAAQDPLQTAAYQQATDPTTGLGSFQPFLTKAGTAADAATALTGTGAGIGKAIAELLLANEYLVFGFSRNQTIKHSNFKFIKIDLSNLDQVQKLELPKVKAEEITLINNAATIGEITPLHLKSETSIINDYNLNILAPTLLCKKFLERFSV